MGFLALQRDSVSGRTKMNVRRSKKAAAQTKHVFDNLGTAAEIPEQGKFGSLIGSYPRRC